VTPNPSRESPGPLFGFQYPRIRIAVHVNLYPRRKPLHTVNRRQFIRTNLVAAGALWAWPLPLLADNACQIPHPLVPPDPRFKGQCPNCGMVRAMWARTWMTFENSEGPSEACSFHCLAEMAQKAGEPPQKVQTALYTQPETMVAAEGAAFVVGSTARGTMTMQSKLAFADRAAAQQFSQACEGRVVSFEAALDLAGKGIAKENKMIAAKRRQTGKIVEPADNQERCPVCEMFPARYPRNRAQIHTREKTVYHFCSTQCLFAFLKDSAPYAGQPATPFLIWVADNETRELISARTAYYVVGSREMGPMGHEGFAFGHKDRAAAFARKHGGRVLPFKAVSLEAIKP
jgi:nitrous oxide reductase accessory protein NosL